jgi:hypothetical protein
MRSHDYEAVGIGSTEAKKILRRALWSGHSLPLVAMIACYAIQRAKESVASCGKNTVLFFLTNNYAYHVYPDVIDKAEALFRKYEAREYIAFMYAVGNPYSDESRQLEKMNKWSRELREELREEFMQLASQILKDSQ